MRAVQKNRREIRERCEAVSAAAAAAVTMIEIGTQRGLSLSVFPLDADAVEMAFHRTGKVQKRYEKKKKKKL